MALPKRVKSGGSYYKGYKLVVSAATGDYVLNMTESIQSVINGITITPDTYGAGDTIKLEHLSATNATLQTIAETIYNPGSNTSIQLDFSALEQMEVNETLRLTYTSVAGLALNVYTILEKVR